MDPRPAEETPLTAVTTTVVTCDVCGATVTDRSDQYRTRHIARAAGWRHAGLHDYCPAHRNGKATA